MINGNIEGLGISSCMDDYLLKAIEIMKKLSIKSPFRKSGC
jgi:hypothetical protein